MDKWHDCPQMEANQEARQAWRRSRFGQLKWLEEACNYLQPIVAAYVRKGNGRPFQFCQILEQMEKDSRGGALPQSGDSLEWDSELKNALDMAHVLLAHVKVQRDLGRWD